MGSLRSYILAALIGMSFLGNCFLCADYIYGVSPEGVLLVSAFDYIAGSSLLFETGDIPLCGAAKSGEDFYFYACCGRSESGGELLRDSSLYKVFVYTRSIQQVSASYGGAIDIRELAYDDDNNVLYGTDY